MPGLATLECRAAALSERAGGLDAAVARRVSRAAARLAESAGACAVGDTSKAQRRLDGLRFRLFAARRRTERGLRRGTLALPDGRALLRDLGRLQALRRATRRRLERAPCPELFEILRPAPGEVVRGGEIFALMELGAAADPGSPRIAIESPGPAEVFGRADGPAHFFVSVPCRSAGDHVLRFSARERGGALGSASRVTVRCEAGGFPGGLRLGAEVEVLIEPDAAPGAVRLTPVRPLRSGATYAVVATSALRTRRGRPVEASSAFRSEAGLSPPPGVGAEAHYGADPLDARNPFPSDRLVQPDGTVRIPDGFSARFVPDVPRLDGVRAFLEARDAHTEEHRGFSPHTSIVLHFAEAPKLERLDADALLVVELAGAGPPGSNLPALLSALESERGIAPEDVALASVFPVEDLAGELTAIRHQIAARAAGSPPTADWSDPDPADADVYGVFLPGEPGFDALLGGAAPASAGIVARGRLPSPDYREAGRFPRRFLDGSEAPPHVAIDFLLVVPDAKATPTPTILLQHGFGGDEGFVAGAAADFLDLGAAVAGIPAPEHGTRGVFLDFFAADDFNAFGNNFRQASVDLFQLVQLLRTALDLDGRGVFRAGELGYAGVSLGGVIGGVFVPAEPEVRAAVLNVAGGRLAQFAGGASPFAATFFSAFAGDAGIPARTCGGDPVGATCANDGDCAPGVACRLNADFELLLEAALPGFQAQLDPGDGSAYARRLRIEPGSAGPKPVLVQEGIGDAIVTNPLTEALARAIGLPANRAQTDLATGVAGLWRFPPPAGHGIFALPEVRAQAATFLATGGGVLAAP